MGFLSELGKEFVKSNLKSMENSYNRISKDERYSEENREIARERYQELKERNKQLKDW